MRSLLATAILATCLVARTRAAEENWPRLDSGPLQDNSFVIEEAYNQEAGVVQHIVNAAWDPATGDWVTVFTQEWPLGGQTNQLSFTVPYRWAGESAAASGIGDVLLNYRYQALSEKGRRPAFAPRLSLVLPTGDYRDELGHGSPGVETNLPVSKQLADHWATHVNLGARFTPNARIPHAEDERLTSWFGGGSLIWEPVDAINFLAELLALRQQDIEGGRRVERTRVSFLPGVRVGWNGPGSFQWVGGLGFPIGLTRDSDDFGVFLYLSIEHAFTAEARAERAW